MKPRILVPASLALFAGHAHAQLSQFSPPVPIGLSGALDTISPQGSPYTGALYQCVTADLDGNLDLDVVYRTDSGLLICMNPLTLGRSFAFDLALTDMQAWSNPSGADRLVCATPAGLSTLDFSFNPVTDAYVITTNTLSATEVLGLKELEIVPSTSTAEASLVGLGSDGKSFVSIVEVAGSPPTFAVGSAPAFAATGDVANFVCVDFARTEDYKIAAATSLGLEFFDLQGVSYPGHTPGASGGIVERIASGSAEQVAWLHDAAGGGSAIRVANLMTISTEASLAGMTAGSASAADFDRDGDLDLAVGLRDSSQVLLLKNIAGTLSLTENQLLSTGNPASANNAAQQLALDIDCDGEIDVLCVDRNSQTLDMFLNHPASLYIDPRPDLRYFGITGPNSATLNLKAGGYHIQAPGMATHIETDVFYLKAHPRLGWIPTLLVPFKPFQTSTIDISINGLVDFNFYPVGQSPSNFLTVIRSRFVNIQANEVVKRWAPAKVALVNTANTAAFQFVADKFGANIVVLDPTIIGNGEKVGHGNLPPPPPWPPLPPLPPGP